VGIFSTKTKDSILGTSVRANQCDTADKNFAPDCAPTRDARCKTNKAFINIGVISNVIAAVLLLIDLGPVAAFVAALAGVSYTIVWAIWLDRMNKDLADCGYRDTDYSLGAAFGCTAAGSLLCWIGVLAATTTTGTEG
jgi:hypothetical protein